MPKNESFKQMPPDDSELGFGRFRILLIVLPLMFAVTLLLIPVLSQVRRSQQNRERIRLQDEFVQHLESQGGRIVAAPADASGVPPALLSVDLSDVTIDGDLIERLSQFTSIERLNLDGAKLASGEYGEIGRLTKLRNLSLVGSTISDNDLPWDALRLTALSLRNTSITDIGLLRLVEMTSLANLDISGTAVSAEGFSSLRQLSSLKTLGIDDACITQDSVMVLKSMASLEVIHVSISDGLGQQVRELMRPLAGSALAQGLHPKGNVLWTVDDRPWEDTLAGVVELVTDEVDLDPQQVTQLIDAIGAAEMARPPKRGNSGGVRLYEPNWKEIQSVDEFLRRLHDPGSAPYEVRAFARDRFTKDDVPKLLDVLRAQTNLRGADYLDRFGSYLLVRDGLPDPEAAQELNRMLSHEDPTVRIITMYAFGRYGHPFGEEWVPSEAAVEFGMPWLLKFSNDPESRVQSTVPEVLADLAYHHPNCGGEAMTLLVGMFERGLGRYTNFAIQRIVEVNPAAARASIPELRRLLKEADDRTAAPQLGAPMSSEYAQYSSILQALCDVACGDPETAHEIAVDYLSLVRDGQADGHELPTLVAPENSAAVRTIVYELIDISAGDDQVAAEFARHALPPVAKAIRDYRLRGTD
jgi:hypothetical protein